METPIISPYLLNRFKSFKNNLPEKNLNILESNTNDLGLTQLVHAPSSFNPIDRPNPYSPSANNHSNEVANALRLIQENIGNFKDLDKSLKSNIYVMITYLNVFHLNAENANLEHRDGISHQLLIDCYSICPNMNQWLRLVMQGFYLLKSKSIKAPLPNCFFTQSFTDQCIHTLGLSNYDYSTVAYLSLLEQIPFYIDDNYLEKAMEILDKAPYLLKYLYVYPFSQNLTEEYKQLIGEKKLEEIQENEKIFRDKFLKLIAFVREKFPEQDMTLIDAENNLNNVPHFKQMIKIKNAASHTLPLKTTNR